MMLGPPTPIEAGVVGWEAWEWIASAGLDWIPVVEDCGRESLVPTIVE